MKIRGLNKVQNDLKKLKKNTEKMDGKNSVPFDKLFSYEFMSENTNFDSIEEFFQNANIQVDTQEEFQKLDDRVLNDAVIRFSKFSSWDEMAHEAGAEYVHKKLFEGIK